MTMIGKVIRAILQLSSALGLSCDSRLCPPSWKGDTICDTTCSKPACNYDSGTRTLNKTERFLASDCYEACTDDCPDTKLGDGTCNDVCNTEACSWDLGDCSYCADGCKTHTGTLDLFNNDSCNVYSCDYDSWRCRCSDGCTKAMLGNGSFDDDCYTSNYNYDQRDCVSRYCTSGCYPDSLQNQVCSSEGHVAACDYDGKNCQCAPECFQELLKNEVCDSDCSAKGNCKLDNYKCVNFT
jgi:hypothetical protein